MATIEYWIQLENRPWDSSPHNIDRITEQDMSRSRNHDSGAQGENYGHR
jgi:hypothetical protein